MKVMIKKNGYVIRCRDLESGKDYLQTNTFKGDITKLSEENKKEVLKDHEQDLLDQFEELKSLKNHSSVYYAEYLKMYAQVSKMFSVETKISDTLDSEVLVGGFIAGELNVVTGISGGGKTAFCTMLTACMISGNNPFLSTATTFNKKKVIYVSLEQRREQIEARIISTLTALNNPDKIVDYSSFLTGSVENVEWLNLGVDLFVFYRENLKILDLTYFGNEPTVYKIMEKLHLELASYGNDKPLVIIDRYENIIDAELNSDSYVARELKQFAEQTLTPVILQAQMNKSAIASSRNSDGSFDFKKLSGNSLKGNSGLEHQASTIVIIVPEDESGTFHGKPVRLVRIVTAKNRYGTQANAQMWFAGGSNLFIDLDKKRGPKPKFIIQE